MIYISRVFFIVSIMINSSFSSNDEVRLFNDLFLNNKVFSSSARPVYNKSIPVVVKLNIAFVQVVGLNDRDQSLKSNIWIRQFWKNEFVTWNPMDYGNITELIVDKKWIWKPDLVLYNSVESTLNGQLDQYKTRIIIKYDGTNSWYIPAIIESGCSINIKYFPFDIQKCTLKFGSWSFSSLEMDLISTRNDIDTSFYQESSAFFMLGTKAQRNSVKYGCCPHNIIDVTFTIILKRQPGYYVFNVIIPTMVLTFYAGFVFAFPPETGERMGLAIQCFLTISILMMMVSDLIPIDSNVTPMLGNFMITCMFSITFSIVMNAVCFNLDKMIAVPPWLHDLVFNRVAPIVMFKSCLRSIKKSGTCNPSALCEGVFAAYIRKQQNDTSCLLDNIERISELKRYANIYGESQDSNNEFNKVLDINSNDTNFVSYYQFYRDGLNDRKDTITHDDEVTLQNKSDIQNVQRLLQTTIDELEADNIAEFWRCICQTIDRLLLLLLSIIYVSVSISLLYQIPKENFD